MSQERYNNFENRNSISTSDVHRFVSVEEIDISENSEEFDGVFQDFDFDGILKQSDSPLAQQLLAVDNIYNENGEVILGQKGWFDSEQVREERRIKKLKQIMKMVFFLQVCSKIMKFRHFYKAYKTLRPMHHLKVWKSTFTTVAIASPMVTKNSFPVLEILLMK